MKRYMNFRGLIAGVCTVSVLGGLHLQAQDINGTQQLVNRGFEEYDNDGKDEIEPVGWNSFMTATTSGGIVDMGKARRLDKETGGRPGSAGSYCVKLRSTETLGINANGLMTTGRVNMGSATATDASNHAYTDRSHEGYYLRFTTVPDSMVVWAKYETKDANAQGQLRAIIHDDYEMWDPWTTGMLNHAVAMATINPDLKKGDGWIRYSVPFKNDGCSGNEPHYLLLSSTTNKTPGGSAASLYLDDILFVYNPEIKVGDLPQHSFNMRDKTDQVFEFPYTLTGTILPDANSAGQAGVNDVIAELSDAAGSFAGALEIGRVKNTETGGTMRVAIPGDMHLGKHYRIRLRTTNRPLISEDNGQDIVLMEGYTVSVGKNGEYGTVSGAGAYELGNSATVKAVANIGYHFARWEEYKNGAWVSVDNAGAEYTFTVGGDRNFRAIFEINTYTLTVNTEGSGSVSVDPVSEDNTYEHGTAVTITATAGEGSVLNGYYRGSSLLSQTSPYTLTMTKEEAITVKFEVGKVRVTATTNDNTLGSVTGGGLYKPGDAVTLKATPANRYCNFVAWVKTVDGQITDTVSRELEYTFEMQSVCSFMAIFSETRYTVGLNCSPAGAALLTGGGTFSATNGNLNITVQAQANGGYEFLYWKEEGDEEQIGDNPYVLLDGGRLTRDITLTAYFKTITYKVEADAEPEGSALQLSGGGQYAYHANATLELVPIEGYDFTGWYEAETLVSTSNPYTFSVERAIALKARLQKRSYTVALGAEKSEWGSVSGDAVYYHGDTVKLEAAPAAGYVFSYWAVKSGLNYSRVSEENPWVFTAAADVEYYAVFITRPKEVRIVSIPEGVGRFSGAGRYQAGEIATLQAFDVHGYHFSRWVNADTSTSHLNGVLRLPIANDTTLRALYLPSNFDLLVMTEGAQSHGLVSIDTGAFTVRQNKEVAYDRNVLLRARPNQEGYAFWQWRLFYTDANGEQRDEFYSKSDSVMYKMSGDAALVAYFVPNAFNVRAGVLLESRWDDSDPNPDREHAVSVDTFGRVDGEGNYRSGNWIELDAVPEPGYVFSRWVTSQGEEFVKNRTRLLMEVQQDTFVFALFKPDTIEIVTSSASLPVWGDVLPGGVYGYGDSVRLQARPAYGYEFAGWYKIPETPRAAGSGKRSRTFHAGDALSLDTVYRFRAEESFRVEALFVPKKFEVKLTCFPEGSARLYGEGWYDYQSEALLKAEPKDGYEFKGWRIKTGEDLYDTLSIYAFPVTVLRDVEARALFSPIPLRWEARSQNLSMGRVMETREGSASPGETIVFKATPEPNYQFAAWKDKAGNEVSRQSNLEVTLSSDTLLYAHFVGKTLRLSALEADNHGLVEAYPGRNVYGSIVELQATPNSGYRFDKWTSAADTSVVLSTSSVLHVTMTRDSSLLAYFKPREYPVSVAVEPIGSGNAEIWMGAENLGEQALVAYGSELTLKPFAVSHYDFSAWMEGDLTLEGATVTVRDESRYTAVFVPKNYVLEAVPEPAGYGSVTGGGAFKFGQAASLKAEPGEQYVFVGWRSEDGWVSDEAEFDFYPDKDIVLTAVFEVDSIRVKLESKWGGGTQGTGRYETGAEVQITAVPYSGHQFVAWTNAAGSVVSTQNPYTFVAGTDVTYVAEFKGINLNIAVDATVGGCVFGGGTVSYDGTVSLLAVPDSGYVFNGWQSDDMELDEEQKKNPYLAFDAKSPVSLTAAFTPDQYEIYTEISPLHTGSVSPGGKFNYGANLTFEAFPDANHVFAGWMLNGKLVSSDAVLEMTVKGDARYTAVFEPKGVKALAVSYPADGGFTYGSGSYFYGDTILVGVTPYSGYVLENWKDAGFTTVSHSEEFEWGLEATNMFTATLAYSGLPVTVATPVFDPPANTRLPKGSKVSIRCATEGARIFYTLKRGALPDIAYTEPIEITEETYIAAWAMIAGKDTSDLAEGFYDVGGFEDGRFYIYPNPVGASRILNIRIEASDMTYLRIYSLSGGSVYYRQLSQTGVNKATVQLPRDLSGCYIYEIGLSNGATRRGKIVVL